MPCTAYSLTPPCCPISDDAARSSSDGPVRFARLADRQRAQRVEIGDRAAGHGRYGAAGHHGHGGQAGAFSAGARRACRLQRDAQRRGLDARDGRSRALLQRGSRDRSILFEYTVPDSLLGGRDSEAGRVDDHACEVIDGCRLDLRGCSHAGSCVDGSSRGECAAVGGDDDDEAGRCEYQCGAVGSSGRRCSARARRRAAVRRRGTGAGPG